MKNVFIAVGGSGTKVAEALVRLLAVGFPTRREQNGLLTSAGDQLQIWRIDPDRSSGAVVDLKECLQNYARLQSVLSDGREGATMMPSRWAMDVETIVRDLDPLDLPRADEADNEIKSLRGVLDSGYKRNGKTIESSLALLAPFYAEKDLDVRIDRGFYQKPFIGAAVMSIFSRSLEDDATPAGKKAGLTALGNTPTNFFLCGSLHGGTGACGVPVMAQFLSRRKNANPGWGWRVGGALLAPFVKPPMPPFNALPEGEVFSDDDVDSYVERFGSGEAFQGMTTEEKRELVRQILQGFYADPEDMEARARQGLAFYRDHSADYFDELYLVGKPSPNQLKNWSNGGQTQRNPLNSADVVAALAALNFFSQANTGSARSYVIGSSNAEIPQEQMNLGHLPSYRVDGVEIEAEKVFLATALTNHLVTHQIPWNKIHEGAKDSRICAYYDQRPGIKDADLALYQEALRLVGDSLNGLLQPHREQLPTGWSGEVEQEIRKYLSDDPYSVSEVKNKMAKKMLSKEAKGVSALGRSEAKFTTFDFGAWCPPGDQFTRGEYLRYVWANVFTRCQDQKGG